MANNRYEIRLTRWNSNWKEETVTTPYGGAILNQMKDLIHGLKDKQDDRAIRLFIYDTQTGEEYDPQDY